MFYYLLEFVKKTSLELHSGSCFFCRNEYIRLGDPGPSLSFSLVRFGSVAANLAKDLRVSKSNYSTHSIIRKSKQIFVYFSCGCSSAIRTCVCRVGDLLEETNLLTIRTFLSE